MKHHFALREQSIQRGGVIVEPVRWLVQYGRRNLSEADHLQGRAGAVFDDSCLLLQAGDDTARKRLILHETEPVCRKARVSIVSGIRV